MKKITILLILLGLFQLLSAQQHRKGSIIAGFSAGPCIANFMNSEAPHKINIFGSEKMPVKIPTYAIQELICYPDYKTDLFKDRVFGISFGASLEYFLRQNLSFHAGIFYEPKGINLKFSNLWSRPVGSGSLIRESYNIRINNHYLTLPVLFRIYMFKNHSLYVEGGLFTAYLLSSRINFFKDKIIYNDTAVISTITQSINNEKDTKREYTHKFDIGASAGIGYVKPLSDKLAIEIGIRANMGIIKVDSKFNNEYTVQRLATGEGFGYSLVRATNYFGLNSKAMNINLLFVSGLTYMIRK